MPGVASYCSGSSAHCSLRSATLVLDPQCWLRRYGMKLAYKADETCCGAKHTTLKVLMVACQVASCPSQAGFSSVHVSPAHRVRDALLAPYGCADHVC